MCPPTLFPIITGSFIRTEQRASVTETSLDGELIMSARTVKLIDQARNVIAVTHVADKGGRYEGTIDLTCAPPSLRTLFNEFEEIVNGQMFSFLDEIETKIASFSLKAVFDNNGAELSVKELQIYPSTGDVSFKLAEVPARNVKVS
jgi:hypothetical protein